MSQGAGRSIWLLIGFSMANAVVVIGGANLPFANHRLLAVVPLRGTHKALACVWASWWCGTSWWAASAWRWKSAWARSTAQGWEFYAVTGALFLTLAFPGFVYRYLVAARTDPADPWT
jgi:hypothetical protein